MNLAQLLISFFLLQGNDNLALFVFQQNFFAVDFRSFYFIERFEEGLFELIVLAEHTRGSEVSEFCFAFEEFVGIQVAGKAVAAGETIQAVFVNVETEIGSCFARSDVLSG